MKMLLFCFRTCFGLFFKFCFVIFYFSLTLLSPHLPPFPIIHPLPCQPERLVGASYSYPADVWGLGLALATAANPSLATVDIRNNKLDAETKAACRAMPAVASRLLYASVGEEQASAAEEVSAAKPGKTTRTKTTGVGEKAGATSRPATSPTSVKKVGTVPLGGDATAMPGKYKVGRC